MTRYMMMPIGRTTVVLVYDDSGMVLCVQRTKWSADKLKLSRKWWARANVFLENALKPAIDTSTVTVTNNTWDARIEVAGALRALSNLLADCKVEHVSGGVIIWPPNGMRDLEVTADLVLRVPDNRRIH